MIAGLSEEGIVVVSNVAATMLIAILTVWLVCHVHDRREEEAAKPKCKRETDVLNVESKGGS